MKWRTLALLTLMPALASAASPPGIPSGWSDGYAYVNGIRVHYYRAAPSPGKPAMVMVHGVTDMGLSWTTLTEKLQGSYDIYMLDARAHGLSDPFTATDDGNTLVKDVVEFVRTMKLEKPILMGHSLGAATVMRIGAEYPDLAKAIIMLDPGCDAQVRVRRRHQRLPRRRRPRERPLRPPPPLPRRRHPTASGARPAVREHAGPASETLVAQNNYRFEDLVATCRPQHAEVGRCSTVSTWALSKKQYHGAYSEAGGWQGMSGGR